MQGGIARFCQDFWMPLLKAIRARQGQPAPYRFFLIAGHSGTLRELLPAVDKNAETAESGGSASLVVLPELGPISEQHVADWLAQFDLNILQRKELAKDAVADGERPSAVFGRLNARNFWTSLKPKRRRR